MSWFSKVWSTFGDMDTQKSWEAEEGPEDEVEYAHFLERFGDAGYRPDGKLKRPEDFTDSHNRELAAGVWQTGARPEDRPPGSGVMREPTPEEMETARRQNEQRVREAEKARLQREREWQSIESARGTAGIVDFLGGLAPPGVSHGLDLMSDAMKEEVERRERRWRRQAPRTRPIQRVPIGSAKPHYGQAAEEHERRSYRDRYGEHPPREPIRFGQIDELGPAGAARRWLEENYRRSAIGNMLRHHTYSDGSRLSEEEIADIMSSL
jgi:hypothetical protein